MTNDYNGRVAAVSESVQRVSESYGVPFLEALALFEDYAVKMVSCHNLLGAYPDFFRLLNGGAINADTSDQKEMV